MRDLETAELFESIVIRLGDDDILFGLKSRMDLVNQNIRTEIHPTICTVPPPSTVTLLFFSTKNYPKID
jgi:hypothetical protein